MDIINIPTEQTTAATDAILAVMAVAAVVYLQQNTNKDRWKANIWTGVFAFLALASALGAIAHGFVMSEALQAMFWQPLYLSLGVLIALFVVGALYDMFGKNTAKKGLPILVGIGLAFFGVTLVWPDNFLVFIIYELAAMLFALGGYTWLAFKGRLAGAWLMVGGIFMTIFAAGVQATRLFSFTFIWQFDHNGVYHLLQMVGLALLVASLHKALSALPAPQGE